MYLLALKVSGGFWKEAGGEGRAGQGGGARHVSQRLQQGQEVVQRLIKSVV